MTFTKAEIVEQVREKLNFEKQGKKRSIEIVEALLEIIKRTLENGDDVLISGFGKLAVKEKLERKGRNPATGDTLMLAPRRVVTFKCSGKLRSKINPPKLATRGRKKS